MANTIATSTIAAADIKAFYTNCLNFYVVLAEQIRMRFPFKSELLRFVAAFKPDVALSGDVANVIPVMRLVDAFDRDLEATNLEWRSLPVTPEAQALKALDVDEFWCKVGQLKGDDGELLFDNIAFVAKAVLSLPQSSANVERIFSDHNLNKTKTRNRLNTATCSALLTAKDAMKSYDAKHGVKCFNWTPPQSMVNMRIDANVVDVEDDEDEIL